MTREAGTALAVLALYILVLLAPLHQAAGLQRDLGKLGFETIDAWSVCSSLSDENSGDSDLPTAVKCPAMGAAKAQPVAVLPPALVIEAPTTADVIRFAQTPASQSATMPDHVGQSRAPPVLV